MNNTISLCVICGNEESLIERFLNSAAPVIDEFCLVRATGNLESDKTVKLARAWCNDRQIPFQFAEYINKADLPHVDDFGAARNLSFSLATCDWQLWLDCDDTLTPDNAAKIRQAVEIIGPKALMFDYAKPGGAACPRERLFRRGTGRWKNAVHETCQVSDGSPMSHVEQIEVHHSPLTNDRPSSRARNLAILTKVMEDAPRHLFYLHDEQFHAGLHTEAVKTGNAAMALLPWTAIDERYEILLNLAEIQDDKSQELLFTAITIQPHRREAFCVLTQRALSEGNVSSAVSYFRMMDSLPPPKPLPWTHRAIWYEAGWARAYLRVRILRASNQHELAENDHARMMTNATYAKGVEQYEKNQPA